MATSLQAKVRECKLDGCKQCANRVERSHNSEDGICINNRSMFDGLPLRCVGEPGDLLLEPCVFGKQA